MRTARHLLCGLLAFAALTAYAAKEYQSPRIYSAKTYPARDEHTDENVTIAADPYDTGDKAQIFVADYREHDIMPIWLVITNDSDTPVTLTGMKVELITASKVKLQPDTVDDLDRRLGHSFQRNDKPNMTRIPLPRRNGPKPSVPENMQDEFDRAMFKAHAVEAHGTQAGFFFFDVQDMSSPLAGAKIVVNNLKSGGKDLWYFEVPMEKYLTYQPGK